MTFAVTVLGSSAMFATPERACSGYLLELGGLRVWLDAGAGTWRNLIQHVDFADLDGIILSHRHPDHVTDVFQAFHARHYGGPVPMASIPVWAPAETIERITGYYRELDQGFNVRAISEGETAEEWGATVSFVRMAHPPETLGVRVEFDGSALAYSADSGEEADFDRLAGDADVFLCEATFQDSDEPWFGHLSAAQAARVGSRVKAKKVVLTHLPPGRDFGLSLAEAQREAEDLDVQLAADGLRLELSA
ncbi:MAG: MBL fold metallo-hydrolase [Actinomycetota bacterium]